MVLRDAPKDPLEPSEVQEAKVSTKRSARATVNAPTAKKAIAQNSAQRRSALRLKKYNELRRAEDRKPSSQTFAEVAATGPRSEKKDVLMGDAPRPAEIAAGKRQTKRTGETPVVSSGEPGTEPAASQERCVETTQKAPTEASWASAARPATAPGKRTNTPPKAPYTCPTCRTCGGTAPGHLGVKCRCREPAFYDRLVNPGGKSA